MVKITYEKLSELLNSELETFKIKNKMYGNSFEQSLDKYGLIAGLTRISDKFNRLENLILKKSNGTSDERLSDTLIDLANYCNMLAIYIKASEIPTGYVYGCKDDSFSKPTPSDTLVGSINQSYMEG